MVKPIRYAVILAAGLGSRIPSHSSKHPKGFISIGGKTLIERSLQVLRNSGIKKIVISTGYLSDWYEKLKEDWPEVECIKNESYQSTGSLQSLVLVQEKVVEDFILLESDLLYEKNAVGFLMDLTHEAVLLSGETKAGDEVYVEGDRDQNLLKLSKNKLEIQNIKGEFVGINRISISTFKELCKWVKEDPLNRSKMHYEEGLAAIRHIKKIPLVKIDDLIWTEIDMESQLSRAETEIYPKLKGEDL